MNPSQIKYKIFIYDKLEIYNELYKILPDFIETIQTGEIILDDFYRSIFFNTFKNISKIYRNAWRMLKAEQMHIYEDEEKNMIILDMVKNEQEKMYSFCEEAEILCNEIILIEQIKNNYAHKTFFLKLKADFYRYKTEMAPNSTKEKFMQECEEQYYAAQEISKNLSITDPVFLALNLNIAVFFYEIKNEQERAIQIAKETFDNAMQVIDDINKEHLKESTTLLQILRDNISLWTSFDN